MIKLDYSLNTPEERKELVEQILKEEPNPPEKYLEIMADYLVLCMEKQEKKEKKLLTENRLTTVNKRETSFEGLAAQFENGEDGIYNLITDNNKNAIFYPKISITKKDLEDIPYLKQIKQAIEIWENKLKTATGKNAFLIKKTIIDLRKDQYVVKNAYKQPIALSHITRTPSYIPLDNEEHINEKTHEIEYNGISLLNPEVCSAVLCNYSKLKESCWGNFNADTWYLMHDFDTLCGRALKPFPLYERLVELKIDGKQNIEIQTMLQIEFGIKHSVEYISSLWRNKIPKIIAETAKDEYLDWYYLEKEKGKYKKCSKCGQIKLAHNRHFSINNTSKDGFYSICKKCRNAKNKKKKEGAK